MNPVEVARHFVLGNHVARVHAVDRLIEVRSDRPHLTRERDDFGPRFAGQCWAENAADRASLRSASLVVRPCDAQKPAKSSNSSSLMRTVRMSAFFRDFALGSVMSARRF